MDLLDGKSLDDTWMERKKERKKERKGKMAGRVDDEDLCASIPGASLRRVTTSVLLRTPFWFMVPVGPLAQVPYALITALFRFQTRIIITRGWQLARTLGYRGAEYHYFI